MKAGGMKVSIQVVRKSFEGGVLAQYIHNSVIKLIFPCIVVNGVQVF